MAAKLTQEMIAEAMARAEKVACRPGEGRCFALADAVAVVRATCAPKAFCRLGWIISKGGRESWDVWLDVHTGEGRLRRKPE